MTTRNSVYAQLVQQVKDKKKKGGSSSGSTTSTSRQRGFQFRNRSSSSSSSSSSSRRSSTTSTPDKPVEDRPRARPVQKDGRIQRLDDQDRELAYQPPVPRPDQAVSWTPPTLMDILADLGLRLVEVGIASMAQEVAYFFTRRRFLPRYMRRG